MVALPAATWDPVYEHEEDQIVHRYHLSTGNVLRFSATDIRKQATGVHAKVTISMNWVALAWTTFNVERDEDRVRLANSAYKHLDGKTHELDRIEFPQNQLKHALDLFCQGLWDEYVGETIGGLMEGDIDLEPAQRVLGDYILKEGGTIIYAPPGSGKSYTLIAMAVSLMYGLDRIWPVYDAAVPLYINVERGEKSMAARLARVNKALGMDPRTPIPFLNARGRSLSDIYEAARRTIRQESVTHVFYDSISRAGFGSMVKDDVANQVMDMLNQLSPAWVALGHSPRADDSHVMGSQMFDAAADLMVQLKSQEAANRMSTGIGLQITKANDLPKTSSLHVFEWNETGLAAIRKGRQGEFAEIEASKKRTKEEEAKAYLLRVGKATAAMVASEFDWQRSHTSALLNAALWCQAEKLGKEVYFSVKDESHVYN